MTATLYPARHACGAPVIGVLWSDPSVPHYACGAYGDRGGACRTPEADVSAWPDNLAPLTDAELAELGELAEAVDDAMIRAGAREVTAPLAVTWSEDEDGCLCPIAPDGSIPHLYHCGKA